MIKIVKGFALIIALFCYYSNVHALGYVSRDCPEAGAKESFTMSWLNPEWLFTTSVMMKKETTSPYYSYEVHNSGTTWERVNRSAAGIHPYPLDSRPVSDYYAGVYGIHGYYDPETQNVEERRRYVSNSCDILNWGINNW